MLKTRQQVFHSSCDQLPDAVSTQSERRWAWVRLSLGLAQMFWAVFSVTLLVRTGVTALALTAVALTGVLTTVSVLLFGARRSKREGS